MNKNLKLINRREFSSKVIQLIGFDWMLITAGDINNFNTMTAAWGGIGYLWNVPVSYIFIRPQRFTFEFTEQYNDFTLSFFDTKKYRETLNYCGTKSGKDVDKIRETGLIAKETEAGNIYFEQASLIMECTKLYADDIKGDKFIIPGLDSKFYALKDYHRMYIGKIKHIWTKIKQ